MADYFQSAAGQWSFVHGRPTNTGRIRVEPGDFQVNEQLGFTPSGAGDHLWLQIRKIGVNTQDVAKILAKAFAVSVAEVGYSGRKDKDADASQWFSLPVAESVGDVTEKTVFDRSAHPNITLLAATRHQKKLKRGTHQSNRFCIIVREVGGGADGLESRLDLIRRHGVPNYFGEQRFGRNLNNIRAAIGLFTAPESERERA